MSERTRTIGRVIALMHTHRWLVTLIIFILIPLVLVSAYKGGRFVLGAYIGHAINKNRGQPLPSFSLTASDGRTIASEELKGKIVVLNFMQSFCSSCEAEHPAIRALVREVEKEEIIVLSVIVDKIMGVSTEETTKTLTRAQFNHPILIADEPFIDAFHGVGWAKITPVTYFVDTSGTIVQTLRGPQTLNELRDALNRTQYGS